MHRGRLILEWDQTAQLLCMLYNANRDHKKSKPKRPLDFHPIPQRRKKTPPLPGSIQDLKLLLK